MCRQVEQALDVSAPCDHVTRCSSDAISSSVHDLSPTLWHALDVWRCIKRTLLGLPDALNALSNCAMGLSTESWSAATRFTKPTAFCVKSFIFDFRVDGIVALQILSDAAKSDLKILRTLMNLARGVQPKPPAQTAANDGSPPTGQKHVCEEVH